MTFLDFFSGIGGFRRGLELCGMVCKGHCEIDQYADRSYRAIFNVKEDEWFEPDITKVEPTGLPRADLWAGGFPCQDISSAGQGRGLAGERSSLFFEMVRLLAGTPTQARPNWLVFENVRNLLSIHKGWDFAALLHSLAEIGYHIEYGLLNSKFHGVPQNRERVYLVAYRHFRAGSGRTVFPIPAGEGKPLIQILGGAQGQRIYSPGGVSCTLMGRSGGASGKTGLYCVQGVHSGGKTYGCRPVLSPDRVKTRQNGRRMKGCGEPAFCLTVVDRYGVYFMPCEACQAKLPMGRIRRLTPRECWRLQGFTDEMYEKAAAVSSESQLYKQAGNSVTIPVAAAVGRRIVEIQEELDKEVP